MIKMTTDNFTPIQKLRAPLSNLMEIVTEAGDDADYQIVRQAYLEVEAVFNFPEFRRYRESFGKLALRGSRGDEDIGFENFREFLGYWDAITLSIRTRGIIRFCDLSLLYTHLQVLENDGEVIDARFAKQD